MSALPGDGALAAPAPLWRHPAFVWPLVGAGLLALAAPFWWTAASALLFELEFAVAGWLPAERIVGAAGWLLPVAALGFGLLASLSPCILPLIPLNVAAIGAADASGADAVRRSGAFVLGAAAALALLGLVGELGGLLLIEQRGPVLLLVGAALVYFAGASLELLPLPFVGRAPAAGRRLGPIAAGAAFSLVATPCASPFVGSLLAAAAAQGVPGLATASMLGFSLGYTALVFVGGVFGGDLVRRLRRRSLAAPRAASAAVMLVAGLALLAAGLAWF